MKNDGEDDTSAVDANDTVITAGEADENVNVIRLGVSSFRENREKDGLYVDKTLFVQKVLESGKKVFLFTRPRRFGKTLNLDTLDAFLNMRCTRAQSDKWFEGTEIAMHPELDVHRNMYPVVRLDLSSLDVNHGLDEFWNFVELAMAEMCVAFSDAIADPRVPPYIRSSLSGVMERRSTKADEMSALKNLCIALSAQGTPPVVLIDEYDNPINHSAGKDLRDEVVNTVRRILMGALKERADCISFAVVTGVMQMAKEGMFSGLNNVCVDSILSTGFESFFGFTPDEVRGMCEEAGHPEKFEEAREWYDGYRFGNADVYNPWSILSYVSNGFTPGYYWRNTGGDGTVHAVIESAYKCHGNLESLLKWVEKDGALVRQSALVEMDMSMSYAELGDTEEAAFPVLAMAGYLNAVPDNGCYEVSIPNKEAEAEFKKAIAIIRRPVAYERYMKFCSAATVGNTDGMEDALSDVMLDLFGTQTLKNEGTHTAIVTMMAALLSPEYTDVRTEMEAGYGFSDLSMLSRNPDKLPNILFEMKFLHASAPDAAFERAPLEALEQIREKRYLSMFEGRTVVYGIGFRGKKCRIERRFTEPPDHRGWSDPAA